MRTYERRIASRRSWLVAAAGVLALVGGTTALLHAIDEAGRALARQAEQPPQVACAPDVPSILSEGVLTVRAWVTDEAGRPIADDELQFEWSTAAGQIEGRDVGTWMVGRGRQLDEATVSVTWRSRQASCTVRVEVVLPPGSGRGGGAPAGGPTGSDRGGRLTGRSFLRPNMPEPEGYGLYSYLLFATPPRSEEDRERALQALHALLLVVQPVEAVERYRRRSEVNVMLVPVTGAIDIPDSLRDPVVVRATATQILDRYDYAHAQDLLLRLGVDSAEGGPYLVSAAKAEEARATQIVFDMRRVVPKLAWDWITAFTRLAAQERSWTAETIAKLALNTRNVLAVAARETPEVILALTDWVRVSRRP